MKRVITILLAAMLILSPAACGGKGNDEPPPPAQTSEQSAADQRAEQEANERAEQERAEQERIAAERAEQERLAAEEAERAEQERLAAEAAERAEQERLEAEEAERAEQERLAREQLMADLSNRLQEEYEAENWGSVVSTAAEIITEFPGSEEAQIAEEYAEEAAEAITAAGEAALARLDIEYDRVEGYTWYYPRSMPDYADIRTYVAPYIGQQGNDTWLRLVFDYTGRDWIFFTNLIINVDGDVTRKSFNRSDIHRDNNTRVWEYLDYEPSVSDVRLLAAIAASDETIVRFDGTYQYDHTVTAAEKAGITDILTVYDYLRN